MLLLLADTWRRNLLLLRQPNRLLAYSFSKDSEAAMQDFWYSAVRRRQSWFHSCPLTTSPEHCRWWICSPMILVAVVTGLWRRTLRWHAEWRFFRTFLVTGIGSDGEELAFLLYWLNKLSNFGLVPPGPRSAGFKDWFICWVPKREATVRIESLTFMPARPVVLWER